MRFIKINILIFVISLIAIHISAQGTKITLTVNGTTELTATLVENSSASALIELLKNNSLTIEMRDYGNMEKVGSIGTTLPRNDEQITTEPGDIILYQGNALVIYYAPNSWNFTRLGKIDNINQEDLKASLGDGDVTVTLTLSDTVTSLEENKTGENDFRVYPNPVDDYFEVKGDFETITLMNMKGQTIYKTQENVVDIGSLTSGIYFLKIESRNREAVIRKVVKRSF
ncbi:cyclophilin-like fold protein [Maribellus maritimus]|uniref:cyclophilin-like fold protein n=1 Tax=Maribellus maritimus TaxID=2870838 RepID=UPI001EEC36D7|nr:cyclophilin-like fold protein [Maribellus maritimus]MCG6189501.1 T9SS type A sorting domain-containing protein [Maribellus maritimus]